MRIAGDNSPASRARGKQAIRTALEQGYIHFDHANIYAGGASEKLFGEILQDQAGIRDNIIITSKCGIRKAGHPQPDDPTRYDFSRKHIINSVEGSLSRLGTDYLDLLLLHRPDILMDAEEVAETFQKLQISGKVVHFGVSNFSPSQLDLLQSYCSSTLLVNQVEINIHNISTLLDGTLDQCQQRKITPMAWCPIGGVAYPAWGNTFSPEDEERIKAELDRQASQHNVENWIIALAWLLKHPAGIMPIVGSTTPSRIKAAKQALEIPYTREDWYRLLEARNGQRVP
jgi:predicted oxidoreductase